MSLNDKLSKYRYQKKPSVNENASKTYFDENAFIIWFNTHDN